MKLEVKNLNYYYKSAFKENNALFNIDFSLKKGDILSILGPNGSGKSTLLKCIAHILETYEGDVLIDNIPIRQLSRKEISKKIAFLTQSENVFFNFTVYERVEMATYYSNSSKKEIEDILHMLDIEKIKNKKLDEISGGQLQRVLIAAALAQKSNIILLDEPTNHLDIKYQIELIDILKTITKEKIIISVMHNIDLAAILPGEVLILNKGTSVFLGDIKKAIKNNIFNNIYETNIREFKQKNMEIWK